MPTLEAMLLAREARVARQQAALAAHCHPVVSLTLVWPGPVKDTPEARAVLLEGVRQVEVLAQGRGWPLVAREVHLQETGPEALLVLEAPSGRTLKEAVVALEEQHALGRLWDMDVHDPVGGAVSRRDLDLPRRRCLLCGEAAHACARGRVHPLPELLARIEEVVRDWHQQRR